MKKYIAVLGSAVAFLFFANAASAATGGGGNLPWDQPLTRISQDLTGPFAYSIAIIGIACVAAALIFNRGEIGDFVRGLIFVVLGVALLVGSATAMAAMGITGAVL